MENLKTAFIVCSKCRGTGKQKRRIKKSVRLHYQAALADFTKIDGDGTPPVRPEASLFICTNCEGCGLIPSDNFPVPDQTNFPQVAIIGGGIGGVALAVACLHRGIPFTLFEWDKNFEDRSQGYGLTLQQASKAIEGFGIFNLEKGIVSTRHLVHTPDGKIVGEWGMRKWLEVEKQQKSTRKKTNIHIARQSLRLALLNQIGDHENIKWNHQLIDLKENKNQELELSFLVDGKIKTTKADLIVGADGIRSVVRNKIIGEENSPLRYLGCIVILGICQLSALENFENPLLDSATVFQTANGNERIYMMPFDKEAIMWQLSFPIFETEAKNLSEKGQKALKEEAILRTKWHAPIPEIVTATLEAQISGYPVYDRALLTSELLQKAGNVTLIGDAAHPMSPFKGQGANQALLDALSLARDIYKICKIKSDWKTAGIRSSILEHFEEEMLARSASKVQDSAAAAEFLHSEIAIFEGDEPRGRVLKRLK